MATNWELINIGSTVGFGIYTYFMLKMNHAREFFAGSLAFYIGFDDTWMIRA
jgi:hypothetical protein